MKLSEILKDFVRPVPEHERAGVFSVEETPIGAAKAAALPSDGGEKGLKEPTVTPTAVETGVANIEATKSIWGKKGFYLVCMGYVVSSENKAKLIDRLAMIMTLL